jgi:hypothetical protein
VYCIHSGPVCPPGPTQQRLPHPTRGSPAWRDSGTREIFPFSVRANAAVDHRRQRAESDPAAVTCERGRVRLPLTPRCLHSQRSNRSLDSSRRPPDSPPSKGEITRRELRKRETARKRETEGKGERSRSGSRSRHARPFCPVPISRFRVLSRFRSSFGPLPIRRKGLLSCIIDKGDPVE